MTAPSRSSSVRRPSARHLSAGAAALSLLATGLVAATAGAAPHPLPATATFAAPLAVGTGAEPSIRVANDGKVAAYISAPTGLGSNFWTIKDVPNGDGSVHFAVSAVQQPDLGTGGGDSEISVSNAPIPNNEFGCDTLAYSGLHNADIFNGFTVARSYDCGKTFSLANPVGVQNTLTDRQWQTFDGVNTNFLIYHKVDTSQIVVSRSTDGGMTYVSLGASGANGIIDAQTLPSVASSNQVGNIVTDYATPTGGTYPVANDKVHLLYATFGGPSSPADNAQAQVDGNVPGSTSYNHIDTIYNAVSADGGLTWTDHKVYSVDPRSHRELNLLFPVVATDAAGHVYELWSDGLRVQYAVSTDHGVTWSKPFQVNTDNRGGTPSANQADLFPWFAAGANGMLDVVWYHGQGGARGSNTVYRDPGDAKTTWTVAFAQLAHATHRDGAGAAAPTVLSYSQAITPVIHRGDICQNGTFCALSPVAGTPYSTGDRSLLDFFQVAIDRTGRAHLAFADNVDSPGANLTAYTRQLSGYSLTTGKPLPVLRVRLPRATCATDAAFTDPAGDATQVVVGTPLPSQPALDITRGWVSYDRQRQALTLHIRVLDLRQDPPAGATGEQVEFSFTHGGRAYVAVGDHTVGKADAFHLESPLRTTQPGAVTGVFDKAHSEITMTVPSALFPTAHLGAGFAAGERIGGLAITSRRDDGDVVVPNADDASGSCAFSVPR